VADVEPLGGFTVVTLEAGEAALRALLRGQPDIRVDARVALSLDPNEAHFFDESGDALRTRGGSA
jgi:multiple sugar transport system ATP-binding protein